MTPRDTIYALSSGAGTAGIAVIRISGPSVQQILLGLCGKVPAPRRAAFLAIRDQRTGDLIDRGIVLWFPAPASFSGEDSAEFQVHGSRAVIDALFRAFSAYPDVRAAEAGEFTLRAFHNGRLDLIEVEGLGDLLTARTDAQRRQALQQSGPALRAVFESWRQDILALWARAEAVVDFVDEAGVSEAAQAEISDRLSGLIVKIDDAIRGASRGEAIRDGIRVVIAGPPNAGKSSLLNFLARREAAIVSAQPGTTRDVIEVMLDIEGLPVIFSDTAGLRDETSDEIEQIGMARTRREVEQADILVWLTEPGGKPPQALIDSSPIWVENKSDLPSNKSRLSRNDPDYLISVRSGDGMAKFLDALKARIVASFGGWEPAMITRARQRECLETALQRLESARNQPGFAIELQAEDLRAAADAIGRLTGKINAEDVLGEIFSAFCVGK